MLKAKTLGTFLFGEAEYFDVFDRWHRTKFCYRLIGVLRGLTTIISDGHPILVSSGLLYLTDWRLSGLI